MTKISVVIPAYNEADGIGEVVREIRQTLTGLFDYEVITVDDGSVDQTSQIATAAGARVLRNPINVGYGASLKRGIEAAANEYVVMVDADGTYPIDKIPELVGKLEDGFDMAVGVRSGKNYWRGVWLNPARLALRLISELVAGQKIPDVNSGLRAFKRSQVLPIFSDLSNRFSFSTSLTLAFLLKEYSVAYIPIDYYERRGKSKVRYIRDGLKTLRIIFNLAVRYRIQKK